MTADQMLALAPDPASAKAGQGLASPRKWVASGTDGTLLWGECQGSGSTPYQTRVELATIAFKCSCPSRKCPCKHVLGLMLLQAGGGVASGDAPDWARMWFAERAAKAEKSAEAAAKPREPSGDPPANAAAAAKRAKAREDRIAAGLAECELWLRDVVRLGLGLAHAQTQPSRYPRNAAELAALGVSAFACTPDLFPKLMAATIERRDVAAWAASRDIVVAT